MRGVEARCRLCLFAFLLLPVAVKADEAADVFDSLFGADLKQVAATPDPADDVALAAKLVAAAEAASKQPTLLALMCDKAWELGKVHPTGHATALKAMELLAGCVPDRRLACQEKVVIIRQLQYDAARGDERAKAGGALVASQQALLGLKADAGDLAGAVECGNRALMVARAVKADIRDIQARLDQVLSLQRVGKQVADLKVRLAAGPNAAAARAELVRLYLVDLDKPAEAAKYVGDGDDPAMRKYVPAAAKPIEDAPELACKELGDWYKGLADQVATPASKGAMLRRAQTYYQRFLMLHTAADLGRTVATLALKRIDDALAVLGPAPEPKSDPKSDPSNMTLDLGNGVTMKLILIPAGKFIMGSPESEKGRRKDAAPQREVVITKPFYMGVTEVTQAQYKAVTGVNPSKYKDPTNPVEMVYWNDTVEFCRKLSQKTGKTVRLPTEAEWEYACRAGTTTAFSFGDSESDLGDYGWSDSNSGDKPHPVGQKKPNPWGLYDMYGSMWEWCQDFFSIYAAGAVTDPAGPGSGTDHVLRGGSWITPWAACRSASRRGGTLEDHNQTFGFRVVVSVSAPGYSSVPVAPAPVTKAPAPAVATPAAGAVPAWPKASQLQSDSARKVGVPVAKELDLGGGITIKLVLIPAGKFMMCDGKDRHEVTLSKPFYMGVTEVTQAQYEAVTGTNPSKFKGPTNPVEMICWNDATEFCKKLSEKTRQAVRLPTEAEWEYSCRAGTATAYSFGDADSALGDYAWSIANGGGTTHPVSQKKPNPWGLYDMHGNVWEWCADWFGDYPKGMVTDPQGPASGKIRVMRGGSWHDDKCRSANVNPRAPDLRVDHYGIRVVVPVSAPGL
jgi:formylglycine-generating enzyme required for sulfatase activity